MIHAVRCPSCDNYSRVGSDDLGGSVRCPHCGRPFTAAADPGLFTAPNRPRPVGRPVARPADSPVVGRRADQPPPPTDHPVPDPDIPPPALLGLALLPWLVPLAWFFGPLLAGREPLFTLTAPVALAVGLSGLSFGVAFAGGWSLGTKIKGVLALFLLSCVAGGFLYSLKREWLEEARRQFGRGPEQWLEFRHPNQLYRVKFPGPGRKLDPPAVPGWTLDAFGFVEPGTGAPDLFLVATGDAPPGADGEAWLDEATKAVVAASRGGELTGQPTAVTAAEDRGGRNGGRQFPGWQFELSLPDGATNRIVQVYRVGGRVFYLSAEGPFWRPDAVDVQEFFRSFQVGPPK